jgi:flagellar P-ring protein precursor FlgI
MRLSNMILLGLFIMLSDVGQAAESVRIKELSRLATARENALVGYGLVTGLAGTGDSLRSGATVQAIGSMLQRFEVNIDPAEVRSKNVATVTVAAQLPPFARPGDKIDVNVTSVGDARSLVGGTLLLTHLTGPDGQIYALAQGALSVGGYTYDLNGNTVQKNHPTTAQIPGGAIVERDVNTTLLSANGTMELSLFNPDFTTALRISTSINDRFGAGVSKAVDPARIRIDVPSGMRDDPVAFVTEVENLRVKPDVRGVVVVNERTGTVVSGGDVSLSNVSVTHGDLKVRIQTRLLVSQPSLLVKPGEGVTTAVVPETEIAAEEGGVRSVTLREETTVQDLVVALNRVKATPRDIITILETIRRSGALHAELIIQ